MRLLRLDLLAFGHFTQVGFDLPAGSPDIHFVFGENEAGKSTALAAVEDILFGIQPATRHGFLHDLGSMRIGGVVEAGTETLEFRRRKGNKDTLLDKDGLPIAGGESVLAPYLGGVERALFARMFCLDHDRLRRGGREILDAQDDVGQILFSAGAGVAGLRDHLKSLQAEADALWGNRRADRRKYTQAEDRLKAADAALRELSVTAARWHELKTAYDEAEDVYRSLEAKIEAKAAEEKKLGRIRRVSRDVARHMKVRRRIAELGGAIALPENALQVLDEARDADAHARTRLNALNEGIASLREERSRLNYDKALLARADDINALHEQRIHIRKDKADLPKRRAELAAAEADLKRLQSELGWTFGASDEIIAMLPPRAKLSHANALSKRRGELAAGAANARSAAEEAVERVAEVKRETASLGTAADLSGLTSAMTVAREAGDAAAGIAAAEREAKAAADAIVSLLASMNPVVPEVRDLAAMRLPSADTVEHHRDRSRELTGRLQMCRERIRSTELVLERHRKEYARTESDEHAVPAEELQRLRARRDAGWSIIRLKYFDGGAVPEADIEAYSDGGSLPGAYQAFVADADAGADRRFESAEATARLAEIARQISEQEEQIEELRGQERGHRGDEAELSREWEALWKHVQLAPASPDEMLAWLASRLQVLQLLDRKDTAERHAASLRDEEARARALVTGELAKLGVDCQPLAERAFRAVVEAAADVVRKHDSEGVARRKLEESHKNAEADVARKARSLQLAEDGLSGWREEWTTAVTLLGLNPADALETVEAQIGAMGEMREFGVRIQDLSRDRIGKIERDMHSFEREVAAVVAAAAPDLVEADPDDAVLELERRLKEAERARQLTSDLDTRLDAEGKKVADCERARREATEAVEHLQNESGVSSVEDLRGAVTRSDDLRALRAEETALRSSLSNAGDGKSLAELTEECTAADPDQTAAREETASKELSDMRARLMEFGEVRSSARREFEAVGGASAAAGAAANRQSALAEMKEIAEEYVRVRTAELLLQATVEQYRRQKQGPLLKRAGDLFAILTAGSFLTLQVEFDEHDKPQLAGVRANGRQVPVSGMSTGTADQLYLALRIAAIEDYMKSSIPLPFLADDLFVHFDDRRMAAGFKVLAELSRTTQVLVFTHHAHLLQIATDTLGSDISIIRLSQKAARRDSRKSSTGKHVPALEERSALL